MDKTDSRGAIYCLYIKAPNKELTRWVKVIDSLMSSHIECDNSDISPLEYMNWQRTDGSLDNMPENHTMIVLQCNNKECSESKFLGGDTFKYDKVTHTVDHGKFGVSLDPNFGESCTPLEQGRVEILKWEEFHT